MWDVKKEERYRQRNYRGMTSTAKRKSGKGEGMGYRGDA
jgi:hypothetical protein